MAKIICDYCEFVTSDRLCYKGGMLKCQGELFVCREKTTDESSNCNKPHVSGSATNNNEFSLFLKSGDAVVVRGNDITSAIKYSGHKREYIQCWAFHDCIHEFYYDNEINKWFVKDEGEEY